MKKQRLWKTSHTKKNEWPEYKLFSSMLFQNTPPPKCPPSTPLSPVPLLTRWNLHQKFSFSWLSSLEKKVEVRVPSYKKTNKTLIMKIASDKFSLHVSLHVCTNFKKEKKNIRHLQINIALAKKLALKKKIEW